MTVPVPDQLEYISDADGVTTEFPYPKRFLQSDEIVVLLRDADGVDTQQHLNQHYSIAGSAWPNGGAISFYVAPASGVKVVRYRMTQAKQTVDLENRQRNDAPSVELQLDRLTMAIQDRGSLLSKLRELSSSTALELLNEITDRINGDKAVASLIGQAGPIEVPFYDTRIAASLANIKPTIKSVSVGGVLAAGDIGQSVIYTEVAAEPTHTGKFKNDSRWMEVNERVPSLPMFGFPAASVETITAKMAAGDAVRIICFGDSTTDGNGTTGWTANPTSGGEAVGNSDHAATAPNAWPAFLQYLLRDMFKNNNIRCFNAGYSGQRMDNGWAYRNYNRAVIENPSYGAGDLVFIGFGLNDIIDAGSQLEAHIAQTRRVILKAMSFGAVPVLLTCDAFWRNSASTRDAIEAQRTLNQAKIGLAKELGIECFDVNMAMQRWFSTNNEGYEWGVIQPDALHVTDRGHRFKAGFIASMLFRDILRVEEGSRVRAIAGDTRFRTAIGQDRVFNTVLTGQRGGMNTYFPAGSFIAGEEVASAWIWNEAEDAVLIYRSLDHDGIGDCALAPVIDITTMLTNNTYQTGKTPNSGGGTNAQMRLSDRPNIINFIPFGLSRVRVFAPSVNTTSWWHGYIEVNTQCRGVTRTMFRRNGLPWSINGLKETGELYYKPTSTGTAVQLGCEAKDLSNVISYGKPGFLVSLLLEARIDYGMGLTILSGKGWQSAGTAGDGPQSVVAKLLFKSSVDNRLKIYDFRRKSDGSFEFYNPVDLMPWNGMDYKKLRIDFIRDATTGIRRMDFINGWSGAPAATVTDAGGLFPSSGYFGDLFSNSTSHATEEGTIHIRSAQLIYF